MEAYGHRERERRARARVRRFLTRTTRTRGEEEGHISHAPVLEPALGCGLRHGRYMSSRYEILENLRAREFENTPSGSGRRSGDATRATSGKN